MAAKKSKDEASDEAFSREQILQSKKFANRRDILNVLLEDDKTYSIEDVENLIKEFLNKNFKDKEDGK